MAINVLRLQDNPVVAKICLVLLSLASVNYLFLAFNKNPLEAIMPGKTVQMVVYFLIGLCGLQFFFKSFDVVQLFPRMRDLAQSGYSRARAEIQSLEHFRNRRRNRYGCGCGM